eukprot:1178855-Prorocentrum_minimum.AAC.2
MSDIQIIVDRLNAEPFNYGLSMVSLSEKNETELLQLVSDVFSYVAQSEPTNVRAEGNEGMTGRMTEFLRIVKYKPTVDQITFRQGISEGAKETLYPVLKWMLPQADALKKRAFVGYYMTDVPIPGELMHDEDTQLLVQEIRDLQADFVNVHKELEAMRSTNVDPNVLKQKNMLLEEEKEQLTARIASTKTKVHGKVQGAQLEELQTLSTALRRQQEEELELQIALRKEKERMATAEQKYQKSTARMREIRSNTADGSSAALFTQMSEDVNKNRYLYNEKIPKDIQNKKARIMTVQKVLQEPMNSESDLAGLFQQKAMLDREVKSIIDKQSVTRQAGGGQADLQLKQQSQIAKSVAKKKEDVLAKLEKLSEKRRGLAATDDTSPMGGRGGSSMLKGDDWKHKFESVKGKLADYKEKKREIDDMRTEALVLSRTEAILGTQEKAISAQVSHLEKQKGVTGFIDTAESLEKVSSAKGEIDEAKGQTLEEISKFVTTINNVIKERKSKLAPQIKDLRAVRQKFQELETDHAEKKKQYDAAAMGFDSKISKLESDVKSMRAEGNEDESTYHYLNAMGVMTDVAIKRVTAGLDSQALRDRYAKKVNQQEEFTKHLKSKQKNVKDTVGTNKNQLEMIRDLKKILEIKISCHKKGNVGSMLGDTAASFQTTGGANVMML